MKRTQWQVKLFSTCAMIAFIWPAYIAAGRITHWYMVRQLFVKSTNIGLSPRPLPDQSIAGLPGKRIELYGFSFQLPWNEEPIRKGGNAVTLLSFRNGAVLIVFNPATQLDSAKVMRDQIAKSPQDMIQAFGSAPFDTNYALLSAELRSEPQRFVPWAPKNQLVQATILLPLKSMALSDATAVYELKAGDLRGFQFGDPLTEKSVRLELFDAADRHYSIKINVKPPLSSALSQSEINAIIASIHPLPPPASTPQRFPT